MGLFSRNEPSADTGRRNTARTSSEAQAAELRVRARRRLIGALVLVLTAIIFVPMLFDSTPEEELVSPLVLPEQIPPMPSEPQVALAPEPVSPAGSGTVEAPSVQPAAPGTPTGPSADSAATPPPPAETPASTATPAKPEPPAEAAKPAPEKPAPARPTARSDDGAVALALLEGREPPKPAAAKPSSGNFILQVAAYTTESDAQSRREKLAAAGVTNAYVENAVANGKTAYRLRVGPFPTRDAAEAAQARLRQLGYNNGLIFNK